MERQTATKNKAERINSSSLSRGILQRKCACGNQSAGGSECAECGKKNQLLQRRAVHISEPGDRYEQEADRVADLVMRMPEPTAKHQVGSEKEGVLQRKAIANSITPLQSSSAGQDRLSEVPPIVDEVLRSPGQPLDTETRTFMELRFGHDFSQVRVHTDAKAAVSAKAVNAHAYTVGRDIVFGNGKYLPGMRRGNHWLAHELTHVLQQDSGHFTNLHKLAEFDEEEENLEDEDEAAAEEIDRTIEDRYLAEDKATRDTVMDNDFLVEDNEAELKQLSTGNLLAEPKKKTTVPSTKKKVTAPSTKNSCNRLIFSEGTCQFLVLNAGGRCCDPEKGIENPRKTRDVEGQECSSKKFTPLFTCDRDCNTAVTKGCDNNDNWMAVPRNQFSTAIQCNDIFTICANGKKTTGYVRDRSVTNTRFEVSPGIQNALGVPVGKSFKGTIFKPGAAQSAIDKDKCCKNS
jgi:hypothetical protein